METFVPAEPRGKVRHDYGLGLVRYVTGELTLYGHAGTGPAHASFAGFDPESGTALAVVINSDASAAPPQMAAQTIAAIMHRRTGQ